MVGLHPAADRGPLARGDARFAERRQFAPPGGESRTHFDARVVAAGRRVGARRPQPPALGRMLVVAHGGRGAGPGARRRQAEYRVGHLAGYWGWHTRRIGLFSGSAGRTCSTRSGR